MSIFGHNLSLQGIVVRRLIEKFLRIQRRIFLSVYQMIISLFIFFSGLLIVTKHCNKHLFQPLCNLRVIDRCGYFDTVDSIPCHKVCRCNINLLSFPASKNIDSWIFITVNDYKYFYSPMSLAHFFSFSRIGRWYGHLGSHFPQPMQAEAFTLSVL